MNITSYIYYMCNYYARVSSVREIVVSKREFRPKKNNNKPLYNRFERDIRLYRIINIYYYKLLRLDAKV